MIEHMHRSADDDCEHPDDEQMIAVCSCVVCAACNHVIARCEEHSADNLETDGFEETIA